MKANELPINPFLAERMYLKGYIERMGTGTADILRIAAENNLKEPVFAQNEDFTTILYRPSTDQVPTKYRLSTPQVPHKYPPSSVDVQNLLKVLEGEMSRDEIKGILGLKDIKNFRKNYLDPALKEGLIKLKYPDNPNHPKQRYLLTVLGKEVKSLSS